MNSIFSDCRVHLTVSEAITAQGLRLQARKLRLVEGAHTRGLCGVAVKGNIAACVSRVGNENPQLPGQITPSIS